ncbi:hypothetical protein [Streptomyces sp. NPDC002671]
MKADLLALFDQREGPAGKAYLLGHWISEQRKACAAGRPVGQWLSNQLRPGALAGHPERVEVLAVIDPDWNPQWRLDWQCHYSGVRSVWSARCGRHRAWAFAASAMPARRVAGPDARRA